MAKRRAAVFVLALAVSGCAGSGPLVSTPPAVASYEEYHYVACQAWDALDRAVGNPETGSGSELSRALDAAAAEGDASSADRLAAEIKRELTSGRRLLVEAGTWQPRARTVAEFDRLFQAFEAMTDAKRALAKREKGADDPQLVFEQAGGITAWYAMFETMPEPGSASGKPCPNVPVAP